MASKEELSDVAPKGGGLVKRRHQGRDVMTPVVVQRAFDEEGNQTARFLVNTGGKLQPLTPIEEELREASEGFISPQTVGNARRQRYAIKRNSRRKHGGK